MNRLFVATSLILTVLLLVPGASSWWDSSWKYRRPINVTEQSGEDLSSYQVRLSLDTESLVTSGKMQDDCGDIRFVNSTGQRLNFWIESGCNTSNTKVWLRLESLEANSEETIHLYYGNKQASGMSSGFSTFPFFDGFEDGSLNTSRWSIIGDPSYVTERDGYIDIQNVDAGPSGSQGVIQNGIQAASARFGYHHSIYTRVKDPDGKGNNHYGAIVLNDDNKCYTGWECDGELISIYERTDDTNPDSEDIVRNYGLSLSTTFGDWKRYRIDYLNSTVVNYFYDGNKIGSRSKKDEIPDKDLFPAIGGQDHDDADYHKYTDYVFVTRQVSDEPSVEKGEEQKFGICDKRGENSECIVNSDRNISGSSFQVSSVFRVYRAAELTTVNSKALIDVSNSSFISGLWIGAFELNADEIVIRPGARLRPEGRIILTEN